MTKLKKDLIKAKHRSIDNFASDVFIKIPDPKGGSAMFRVLANTTMHPDYQEKFPGIRTYDVINLDNPSIHGKIDFTQKGFHAMIFDPSNGSYFIDPLYAKNDELHMVYFKKDFYSDKEMQCEFVGNPKYKDKPVMGGDKSFGNCELKTYRLAVSATGEYTTYHGGDVADAAAAQVTTMNRVNGVYERDMAVTMEIIADNDDIIYTDALTDPFSNGNPSLMINQNQTNTNLIIGSSNYDIGHVFGTNSGGLAGLGVVCSSSSKARGVTGSSNPINDPFDIDYVAHEMGHQFGCNHTFNNSCNGNRNNSTAMEPGSGSTIMAYAGICSPNVQSNSDDHFHGISVEEMGNYIDGTGGNCPVITPLVNSAPEIISTTGDVFIPANTPFALTADVSDIDGDSLLYCWEQMDNEISPQAPVSTSTSGPNFRSNSPNYSPTRYFPNLNDLSNGVSPTWEVLASVSRTFSFRLIVRDNAAGGGCNDHADLTVNTVASAGPFVVTYPTAAGITWSGFSTQTVTWDVTNTNLSPINCQFVDIFLSIDGGETYPTQLANDVANDGSHSITVPNTPSTDCRIMVMSQNGSFFDISNNDFEISEVTFDYTLNTTEANQAICQPDTVVYTIEVGSIGGYNDEVTLSLEDLPAGATGVFDLTTVTPPATVSLTISGSQNLSSNNYSLAVNGVSTTGSKLLSLQYQVFDAQLDPVVLISPADAATGVQLAANLSWENDGFGVNYTVDVATDDAFANIVQNITNLTATTVQLSGLESNTIYYWRVKGSNSCDEGDYSATYSFTTVGCNEVFSSDVPKVISSTSTPTITSTLDITSSGQILGISVVNLTGQHTWINDLSVSLTSPQGTTISLFSGICNNEDDFDINFDDFASSSTLPCPPTDGGTYQPAEALSAFIGEVAQGTWTLTISDSFNQDGGSLDSWGLNLCIGNCIDAEAPVLYTNNEISCFGDPITIAVESGNLNDASDWYWYEDECDGTQIGTGSNITVYPDVNTTYYARGGGFCGGPCSAIDIDLLPIPESSSEEVNICQGESYTFPDGTTSFSSTVHTSVIPASNGCDSTVVTDLNVINLNSTVIQNNGVLSSNQSSNSSTYQWVDCNNNLEAIPGETGQTFTPTQNGSYAVILTSTGAIPCQETSNCIEVIGVGINEQDLGGYSVFPNPSSGSFTLELNEIAVYSELEVIDYRGRVVYHLALENQKEIKIDLEKESDGIYILKLLGEKNVKIEKLIKQ
jgi:subtilisin-like proprotein convertase family protein